MDSAELAGSRGVFSSMKSPFIVRGLLTSIVICGMCGFAPTCSAQSSAASVVNVRLVTDEAEAVLAVLAKRKANQPINEADWRRVSRAKVTRDSSSARLQ